MNKHLRGNLWLFFLTLSVACLFYPTVLWLFAHALFPTKAAGSLIQITGSDGKTVVIGSTLIAQPFTKEGYFQPRPSAASYNATASGGSNWGASNPKLRDRVARQLGPIVNYDDTADSSLKDRSVQKDMEAWFTSPPVGPNQDARVVQWAKSYPTLAAAWVKSDTNKPAIIDWLTQHPVLLEDWHKVKPEAPMPDLADDKTIPFDDLALPFFVSFSAAYPQRWPEVEEFETGAKDEQGQAVKSKRFKAVTEGADIQATFFDTWLQAHPGIALKKVPADMVMASGSGLDPHITLRNANYQLDSVVSGRMKGTTRVAGAIRTQVESIVQDHTFTPLSGLLGEPLVNVLEVNLELDKQLPLAADAPKMP